MGLQNSIAMLAEKYKVHYNDTLHSLSTVGNNRPIESEKGKVIKVVLTNNKIEVISGEDSFLTVGWLLSEVTRRYNDYFDFTRNIM